MPKVKIVVYVPESHASIVREVIGFAGAGSLGLYSHCSFSMKGIGRYMPQAGATPYIGEVGKLQEVVEERIEVTCAAEIVDQVIAAIRKVHPYEEVALDVYALAR